MRSTMIIVLVLLSSVPAAAQDADNLRKELEGIHAQWFKAFDTGDGATMDQIETDNLILVMPNGTLFPKTKPRSGSQSKHEASTEYELSDVSVRRFGNTAILTGILTAKTAKDTAKEATMV